MKCRHAVELLPELVAGELHDSLAAEVKAHVSVCAECGAEMAAFNLALGDLSAPRMEITVPAGMDTFRLTESRRFLWLRPALAGAFIAAILLTFLMRGTHSVRQRSMAAKPKDPITLAEKPIENKTQLGKLPPTVSVPAISRRPQRRRTISKRHKSHGMRVHRHESIHPAIKTETTPPGRILVIARLVEDTKTPVIEISSVDYASGHTTYICRGQDETGKEQVLEIRSSVGQ